MNCFIKSLLCLVVAAMVFFGCRKKEAEEPVVAPVEPKVEETVPAPVEPKVEAPASVVAEPEGIAPGIREVNRVISIDEIKNFRTNQVRGDKTFDSDIVDTSANLLFPKNLGEFIITGVYARHTINTTDFSKIPYCVTYIDEKLKSTVCIFIEALPSESNAPQSLDACMNRFIEQINQVAEGILPKAIPSNQNTNQNRIRSGISVLNISEASQDEKFESCGLAYKSVSWSWIMENGRAAQYFIEDSELVDAGVFWSHGGLSGNFKPMISSRRVIPKGERQFELRAMVIPKDAHLITVIVQSEGGEAIEMNGKATREFASALDKNVLSGATFIASQDDEYANGFWCKSDETPTKFHALPKDSIPQGLTYKCLTAEEMQGKTFRELCGVDGETKIDYGKLSFESRLADAKQTLLLYLDDYSKLPSSIRVKLNFVFRGEKGYIDADTLLAVLGNKELPPLRPPNDDEAAKLALREKILREKIVLRLSQVVRISRIMENNRLRKVHAANREIDARRTALLESHIQHFFKSGMNNGDYNDRRQQASNLLQLILDELKSGKVSPSLRINSGVNFYYADGLRNTLFSIANNNGINIGEKFPDFVKVIFDLGDDQLAMALMGSGVNIGESHFSYMLSNGLNIDKSNNGMGEWTTLWNSPRIAHLLVLENQNVPRQVLNSLIIGGKLEIMRELLLADAPVNDMDQSSGYLPLGIAIMTGNDDLEQLLLANGASTDAKDKHGKTPEDYRIHGKYWKALNAKDHKTQKECLDNGLDPNIGIIANYAGTYLNYAIQLLHDNEAVRLLLEAKANIGNISFSHLQNAFYSGDIALFKLLLNHGAQLVQNEQHIIATVLQYNGKPDEKNTEFLKEVLARSDKAILNQEVCSLFNNGRNTIKCTPACYVILQNSVHGEYANQSLMSKLKLLETEGGMIAKQPTEKSLSPLFFIPARGSSGNVDIYSYLLSKGCDINDVTVPKSDKGDTHAMFSDMASKGVEKTGFLTFVARMDAKRNYTDNNFIGNVLPYLLEKGAKTDIKDSFGKSCLDYVEEMKNKNKQAYDLWMSKIKGA